jgi:hypothetical protein
VTLWIMFQDVTHGRLPFAGCCFRREMDNVNRPYSSLTHGLGNDPAWDVVLRTAQAVGLYPPRRVVALLGYGGNGNGTIGRCTGLAGLGWPRLTNDG